MMHFSWNSVLLKFSRVQCKTCVELSSLIRKDNVSLSCFLASRNLSTESNLHSHHGRPSRTKQRLYISPHVSSHSSLQGYIGERLALSCINNNRSSKNANVSPVIRSLHTYSSLLRCENRKPVEKCLEETNETPHKSSSKEEDQKLEDIKENIYTIPNLLTSLRIAVTPYLGYLVLAGEFDLGFKIFLLAGLSDFLDGFIARNFENQQSVLGSALDPFADKLLVSILTITLTMAELLPVPLTCLIIGRDALLICAGFYLRYITLPPPRNLKRYFDVSHATVTLLPSTLSKWNTGLQLCLIAASMAAPVFGFVDHLYLQGLWYLTGATTVGSGIQYVVNRNKYIKFTQEKLKRKI
ncbi:cardiolipin synthase (CMP-forming)-like isoform X1 [Mizuhopecten yessoensis]|uniref:cardiolipin synthase (CMP-forming) n=1 Tax=Mizuhopecten yessoensis TaxID=6573 RepID=A0A210PMC6_MIZYE|nr:cardiolipin synthase (CMP-forming)-like isoform X1 [Mizuhopecten yessoensis]OWF37586.1 cardiolipin synthase [Mizuhopecten yessoensis]